MIGASTFGFETLIDVGCRGQRMRSRAWEARLEGEGQAAAAGALGQVTDGGSTPYE